jgi:hypothetical protein
MKKELLEGIKYFAAEPLIFLKKEELEIWKKWLDYLRI